MRGSLGARECGATGATERPGVGRGGAEGSDRTRAPCCRHRAVQPAQHGACVDLREGSEQARRAPARGWLAARLAASGTPGDEVPRCGRGLTGRRGRKHRAARSVRFCLLARCGPRGSVRVDAGLADAVVKAAALADGAGSARAAAAEDEGFAVAVGAALEFGAAPGAVFGVEDGGRFHLGAAPFLGRSPWRPIFLGLGGGVKPAGGLASGAGAGARAAAVRRLARAVWRA